MTVDSRGKSQAFVCGSNSNESEKIFPKIKVIFRVDLPPPESTGAHNLHKVSNLRLFLEKYVYLVTVDSRGKSQAFLRGSNSNESEKIFPKTKVIFRVDLPPPELTGAHNLDNFMLCQF